MGPVERRSKTLGWRFESACLSKQTDQMNQEDFEKCVDRRLALIRETLISKGKEYASDGDRLHNFNATAAMNRVTRETALWGMASKHVTSVIDMVKDTERGLFASKAKIDEKLGDFIVYGVLLEACFVDRMDSSEVVNTVKP